MPPELPTEGNSTEERLERIEQEVEQLKVKGKKILRNSFRITILRYSLVVSLGGVGLVAALLSGANYERKTGDISVAFRGAEFKSALQIISGFAGSASAVIGFGDRFIKKGDDD